MSVLKKIKKIQLLANEYYMDDVFLVGGVPRDYAMGLKSIKTTDVDVTTNTPDSSRLGLLLASHFDAPFKFFEDGHVQVRFENFSIDFSSNFISSEVIGFLKSEECTKDICPAYPDIDEKLFEVYSRDFTINTLHQDLDSKEIFDFTGRGLDDIDKKIIKTPVPPEITINDDPRRVFRGIYFACKYNFELDNAIKSYVSNNLEIFDRDDVKDSFVTNKISQSMKFDDNRTIDILKEMGILHIVPLNGIFKDYIIKNKMVLEYLDGGKN